MTPLYYIPIDGTYHICDSAHKRGQQLFWRTYCGAVVNEIISTPHLPDGVKLCVVCLGKVNNDGGGRKTLPKTTNPLPAQRSFL